jgi:uncharacterized membrane protein YesL
MRKLLSYYGPIFTTLSKIGDFAILNLLVLLGCLPVVTAGASVTAGHLTALKLVREEGNVLQDFWESFVCNIKQGTILWLGFLLLWTGCVLGMPFFSGIMPALSVVLGAILLLSLLVSMWVFPVLSRFIDRSGNILRNAAVLSFRYLWRTLAMLLSFLVLPLIIMVVGLGVLPLWLLFGISIPLWLCAKLYEPIFSELENQVLNKNTGAE